jgi:hypothetical protein
MKDGENGKGKVCLLNDNKFFIFFITPLDIFHYYLLHYSIFHFLLLHPVFFYKLKICFVTHGKRSNHFLV